jgi:hypothetical protein
MGWSRGLSRAGPRIRPATALRTQEWADDGNQRDERPGSAPVGGAKKKERVPWNALFGLGSRRPGLAPSMRRSPNPRHAMAPVNGVQFVPFRPEVCAPRVLTSGSPKACEFAKLAYLTLLCLPARLP